MVALVSTSLLAQTAPNPAPAPAKASENPWDVSLTTSGYIVPKSSSYVSPDLSADRGKLHLEARYNDEALQTGSLWVGYNFSAGKKLVLNTTAMAGAVFGDLNGIAPGGALTLSYKKLQLYSSFEYVFDLQHRNGSFFYVWDQLTYSPLSWLQVGLVSQRTRAYQTGLDVQRGVLGGVTYKKVNFTANIFNFGWTKPTEVLAVSFKL
jgi:hypothetical protein